MNASNINNLSNVSVQPTTHSYHHPSRSTFALEQLKKIRERGSEEQGISESAILKEVTYRLQGIKSEFILTDSLGQSSLKPTIQVSDTVRKIVK